MQFPTVIPTIAINVKTIETFRQDVGSQMEGGKMLFKKSS